MVEEGLELFLCYEPNLWVQQIFCYSQLLSNLYDCVCVCVFLYLQKIAFLGFS
jgi:hypothetical protein